MTTPDEAAHPGPPPICWSPRETSFSEIPWLPGFLVWHRSWGVWVRLVAADVFGENPPHDGILLTPEHVTDGAAEMAARLDRLERILENILGPRIGEEGA